MDVNIYISALVQYGLSKGLFNPCDKAFIIKQLLSILQLDSCTPAESVSMPLEAILQGLLADAERREICDHTIISRDSLETQLMSVMTPSPHEVQNKFASLYKENPKFKFI